jgi:hypothetical protein
MVATFPSQYPHPIAPGGLRHFPSTRPLRGPPSAYVRQPYLGSPPNIMGLAGFGAGAGAFIANDGADADQSQGLVIIRCGLNPLNSGAIQINFPAGVVAGQYVGFADWCTFTNVTVASPTLQFAWGATRPLLPNEVLRLAYQWAVSQ